AGGAQALAARREPSRPGGPGCPLTGDGRGDMSTSVATRPPLRRAVGRVVGSGVLGAGTTPGRLLRVEAVLVLAALVLGVLGVLGGMSRASAVHDARTRVAAPTTGAADV